MEGDKVKNGLKSTERRVIAVTAMLPATSGFSLDEKYFQNVWTGGSDSQYYYYLD